MSELEFYEQINLADNGGLEIEDVSQVGSATPAGNQFEFYNRIALNNAGELKIVITNP
jgi:hypothetical protein